ncbi:hypothetical protein DIE18_24020 [Burkholderia sp. Bp9125]|nr:hypothetical protein DIE18_24020 [Burkholderia sp. Bp9125]
MIKLITLATTTAVATLLTGCVVGPDAGYGYGYGQQTYYSDPGYAYGPSYAPLYGTVNVWGGGGGRDRDWDRRDYRHGDRDWRRDRNWGDRNWGGDRNGGDRHWDRGNGNGNAWGHANNGNRSNEGNRGNGNGGGRDWRSGQVDNYRGNGHSH